VLAPTLGPIVGGWITQTYSWHWLFLINVIPGIAACAVGLLCLPRDRQNLGLARGFDWSALVGIGLCLASLEIALKEAPQRGWLSTGVLAIFALFLLSGSFFVVRTLRARTPIVDLTALSDKRLAVGCLLSFLTGIGLYGSVYLMPVFLSFVRGYGSLRIGEIMLVTGIAQLLTAPLVIRAEQRIDAGSLTLVGFILFGVGLGWSAFQTRDAGFNEMFWPQVIRGAAIMLCLLPPTRVALGHFPPERVPDASSLFNLMRNLGGAIGLALIDTVIWSRAPEHARVLLARLMTGDFDAARAIGVPESFLAGPLPSPDNPMVQAYVRPLLERAGLAAATNEAWAMVASLVLLGPIILVLSGLARRASATVTPGG
jgi:DHA2 family multidrug resistance protein